VPKSVSAFLRYRQHVHDDPVTKDDDEMAVLKRVWVEVVDRNADGEDFRRLAKDPYYLVRRLAIDTGVQFNGVARPVVDYPDTWTGRPAMAFLGASEDLLRNIHGIGVVAALDGDEVGYLVGKVAEIKRQRR
jgi:hypothetical protein